MSKTTTLDQLSALLTTRQGRQITAIAGPPGAGKSTLAEALCERLNMHARGAAAVFPMDGYHYDDIVLNERGDRPRKGAPHTFDVAGFGHTLRRLKSNNEPGIAVPVFDRSIEIARAGARIIDSDIQHIITEGNYLLLDQAPWSELQGCFDITVFVDVPRPVLEQRLRERWKDLDAAALRMKLEGNDLPNVDLVIENSQPADFVVSFAA